MQLYRRLAKQRYPKEVEIDICNKHPVYTCEDYTYCYIDFNTVARTVNTLYSTEEIFKNVYQILKDMKVPVGDVNIVTSRQWSLMTIAVDGIQDGVVVYKDSYTVKIRINFEKRVSSYHIIERDDVVKSRLYFFSTDIINEKILELEKEKEKLEHKLTQLKDEDEYIRRLYRTI